MGQGNKKSGGLIAENGKRANFRISVFTFAEVSTGLLTALIEVFCNDTTVSRDGSLDG